MIINKLMDKMEKEPKKAIIQPFVGEPQLFKGTKRWNFAIYDNTYFELIEKRCEKE